MSQEQLLEIFRDNINKASHEIIVVVLAIAIILIFRVFIGKLLKLPFILLKSLIDNIVEWFGKLTGCTIHEIKQRKKKVSRAVDVIESSKELADTYKSLKK